MNSQQYDAEMTQELIEVAGKDIVLNAVQAFGFSLADVSHIVLRGGFPVVIEVPNPHHHKSKADGIRRPRCISIQCGPGTHGWPCRRDATGRLWHAVTYGN